LKRPAPVTCLDVQVILSDIMKPKDIERYFTFYKAKGKPLCLVKRTKVWMRQEDWMRVHGLLKEFGARFSKYEGLWEVPLNKT